MRRVKQFCTQLKDYIGIYMIACSRIKAIGASELVCNAAVRMCSDKAETEAPAL